MKENLFYRKVLLYKLQKEDFKTSKSLSLACAKVLQNKFTSEEEYKHFSSRNYLFNYLNSIKRKASKDEEFLESINDNIYFLVEALRNQYPEEFPNENCLGWYSEDILGMLYLQGKVFIEDSSDFFQIQKKFDQIKASYFKDCETNYNNWSQVPVTKGYIFKTIQSIQDAYSSVIKFQELPYVSKRWLIYLEPYISLEKIKVGWLVTDVKKEGGFINLINLENLC